MTIETRQDKQESLARGAMSLVAVQFVYLIGATAMQLFLGRRLGPADYGVFGVVMGFLAWMEAALTGGFPIAVRKYGGEDPKRMPGIARAALFGQFLYSMALFGASLAAAPWLASALKDRDLVWLLRFASIEIPIYGLYYTYVAVLNGKRNFTRQAIGMLVYAVAKAGIILGMVAAGFGVKGALAGNTAAALAGLVAGWILLGRMTKQPRYPIRSLTHYAAGTAVFAILITLLLSIDLFAIKSLGKSAAQVGYYTAASTLARAPFYVFLGIATATLPAISQAAGQNDFDTLRRYVAQSLRMHIILIAPVTAILSGTATGTIELLYSSKYAPAGSVLQILAVSIMLMGIMHATTNMLLAVGNTKGPMVICAALVCVATILCRILIPEYGMLGAALASLGAGCLGLFTAGLICVRKLGSMVPAISVAKTAFAGILTYAAGRYLMTSHINVVICYGLLAVIYVTAMILIREITGNDLSRMTTAFGAKKA